MNALRFITLGCRVNQYESDAMAELLTQAGFEITENPAEADVCIVNTCTVTEYCGQKITPKCFQKRIN